MAGLVVGCEYAGSTMDNAVCVQQRDADSDDSRSRLCAVGRQSV